MRFRNILFGKLAALAVVGQISISHAETLQDRYASLYEKAAVEGSVVFYTSDSQGLIRALSEYWKKKFPRVSLSILAKQSIDIAAEIDAHRAAGQVRIDVFDIALPYVALDWKKKGFLELYKPFEFASFAPADKDEDGAFFVKSLSLLSGAYNTTAITSDNNAPQQLSDILDPKWKDRMIIANPSTASNAKAFFMGLLKTGIIDWPFMEKLARQNVMFTRSNGEAARLLAAGERLLSPMLSSHNVFGAREKGQNIKYFVFKEGAIVAEEVAGILKGSPHPNAAKLLMEVLASAEAQELYLKTEYMWPTHPDAKPGPLLPKLTEVKTIRVDMKLLADKPASDEFLSRFDQTFGRN